MSEKISITGTVETALPLQEFPSGFKKRVLVINTGGEYPQTIPVEFAKDKTDLITGLRKNQEVTAWINLRGNEHNGRYYVSLLAWKLDKGEASQPAPQSPQEPRNLSIPSNRQQQQPPIVEDEEDDIPF